MDKKSSSDFQQETKYFRHKFFSKGLNWSDQPPLYKEYPSSEKILLPSITKTPLVSFTSTLKNRKSIRTFSKKSISIEQLSYLLWATSGIQRKEYGYEFRTAPSAGALYPIETYLSVQNVQGIPKGIYHYSIRNHELEEIKKGDFRKSITHAALDQEMCTEAAIIFIWSAIFNRSTWKYDKRGYRYIYLDAGHIAQNLALSSTYLKLGSCQIGAFFDEEMNKIIEVDGIKESTIYLSVVGDIEISNQR